MGTQEIRQFEIQADPYSVVQHLHDPVLLDTTLASATGGSIEPFQQGGDPVGYDVETRGVGGGTHRVRFGRVDAHDLVVALSREFRASASDVEASTTSVWLLHRREAGLTIDERLEHDGRAYESEIVHRVEPTGPASCILTVGVHSELASPGSGRNRHDVAASFAAWRVDVSHWVPALEWMHRSVMKQLDDI